MFCFRLSSQRLPDSHPRRERERERPPRHNSRGATPGRKPGSSRQVPGWLWLVAGLGGGMLITSLVKLSTAPESAVVAVQAPAVASVKPARPVAAEPKAVVVEEELDSTPTDAEAEPATRFDFYTLLPEREVIVPDREPDTPARSTLPATAAATLNPVPPKATTAAAPVESGEYYLLQAGSFRGGAEAERRRALISALGLQARVETVRAGSDTWYRVHAGPFTARDQLAAARDRLSAEGIETLQLRKKR